MTDHPFVTEAESRIDADLLDGEPVQPAAAGPQRTEVGAGLRGSEVWNAYRTTVTGLFDVSLPPGADPDRFTFRSVTWQGVNVSLHRSWSAAQIMRRRSEQIAHGSDRVVLHAQIHGHTDHRTDMRTERIGPGDVMVYDHTRPIASVASAFETLVLILGRDVAPLPLFAPQAHGLRFPAGSGIAELLVACLTALEANAERLSVSAFEAAALALASMATEPLRAQIQRDEAGGLSAGARLRTRAMAYIDAHLADRGLCPKSLGAHLRVSRSALYQAFEPHGGVRLFILAQRLDRAVQVLLDDPDSHRTLAEVARRHGFTSIAHFSRLFSERFGMPPSRYCMLVRTGRAEWLAAQFGRPRFPHDLPTAQHRAGARRLLM